MGWRYYHNICIPNIYPNVIFYLGEGVSLGHWFASGDAIDSFSTASICLPYLISTQEQYFRSW
jgi:hypothetical protein